jgi:hypothetical protein
MSMTHACAQRQNQQRSAAAHHASSSGQYTCTRLPTCRFKLALCAACAIALIRPPEEEGRSRCDLLTWHARFLLLLRRCCHT